MRNVQLPYNGCKQWHRHQNNVASQKIECPSGVVRKVSEIRRYLYSVLEGGASTGLTGFLSCQGSDLDSKMMSVSLASGFSWSSFYLASLRSCFFFSGPKLDLSALKPKYDSWHLYLRFQHLLLCPVLPQSEADSPLLRFWSWEYLLPRSEYSSGNGFGSLPRASQASPSTYSVRTQLSRLLHN